MKKQILKTIGIILCVLFFPIMVVCFYFAYLSENEATNFYQTPNLLQSQPLHGNKYRLRGRWADSGLSHKDFPEIKKAVSYRVIKQTFIDNEWVKDCSIKKDCPKERVKEIKLQTFTLDPTVGSTVGSTVGPTTKSQNSANQNSANQNLANQNSANQKSANQNSANQNSALIEQLVLISVGTKFYVDIQETWRKVDEKTRFWIRYKSLPEPIEVWGTYEHGYLADGLLDRLYVFPVSDEDEFYQSLTIKGTRKAKTLNSLGFGLLIFIFIFLAGILLP